MYIFESFSIANTRHVPNLSWAKYLFKYWYVKKKKKQQTICELQTNESHKPP